MSAKIRHYQGRLLASAVVVGSLGLATPALAQEESEVNVSDYGTVTLAVQDTDLSKVLEMLSIQSHKNIITSKNVSATISANLYDVTFYEALTAILDVNGYAYQEEGNFIYIYTKAELEDIEKAAMRTESRIFRLQYLSGTDANEIIQPLLSEAGQSSFRGDVQPGIEPETSDVGADNWAFEPMLVVDDYPENLAAVASLLAQLDQPPKQVLIESTILQTTLTEANAFGVDFSVIGSLNFTDLSNPLQGVNNLLAGSDSASGGIQPDDNRAFSGGTTVGNTPGAGGLKIGIIQDDISVFLRVLDEVADNTVMARPKLLCLNRQRAEVLVGRRVGYLSTTATETSTTQSVEFLDTGINLMFRPFISDNGMIRLELSPSVSEAFLREITDANGLTVTIPDELTNEVTANVRVQDGETIVLGGLYRESTNITRRQVPLLGDVPILGAAFRGQEDEVSLNEIIFLITPSVVHDEQLWAAGRESLDYHARLAVGARKGLLNFSHQKMTENYNLNAFDAFQNGDYELALHFVDMSLGLKSNQPEMIAFRERITGDVRRPHERQILERVYRESMGHTPVPGAGGPYITKADTSKSSTVDTTSESAWTATDTTWTDDSSAVTWIADDTGATISAEADEVDWQDEFLADEVLSTTWVEEPVIPMDTDTDTVTSSGVVETTGSMPGATPAAGQSVIDENFVNRFIHEYFDALGLADESPYAEVGGSQDEGSFPFITFDDMAGFSQVNPSDK